MKHVGKKKTKSDFEKFATLVVDELHETEARIEKRFDTFATRAVDELHETEARIEKRFDTFATLVVDELHETEGRIEKRFDAVEGRLETLETDVHWIRNELMHISKRIDRIEERVEGLAGFAKEIDELRDRVRILEQRAGIAR